MSRTFKIVLILLVIASIASAVLAVFAFIGKEREYTKRLLLEDKLAATLKIKRALEKDVEMSKKAVEEKDAKIKEAEARIEKIAAQVEEEKDKSKVAILDLAAKKKEAEDLRAELEKERREKLSISRKLEDIEFDYEKVKREVGRLKSEKERLEQKLSDLKESSVDLDKIVVGPAGQGVSAKPVAEPVKELLRGRVLVVNKDYNFIVTDLGQNEGVQKGMLFEVREGREYLGKAEVDKIYDTMSSATILPGADISNIKKGNLVIESR